MSRARSRTPLGTEQLTDFGRLAELVRTFFDILQPQCPLVDQDMFMQAWEASGRVPENMSPANECLALVIQVRLAGPHVPLGAHSQLCCAPGMGSTDYGQPRRDRPRRSNARDAQARRGAGLY